MRKPITLNDPVYGFITVNSSLIFKLVEHPYFQRLRRISQMGLSSLVYPGAHHMRFEHALGCLYLMQEAISVLRNKGVVINNEESEAMQIAILLHDIGHGPFSHTTERALMSGVSHEKISSIIIDRLNKEMDGALALAQSIFTGQYPRKFMHQLIMGQVDVDRLDYLKRDSFYTGVAEGNINAKRIIAMMNVVDEQLVFEEKGIYSLEKFLLARRLMYWQVYLHKTSLSAELFLVKILERAKSVRNEIDLSKISTPLIYFLENSNATSNVSETTLDYYLQLDDGDILQALKIWSVCSDSVLKMMASNLINRRLLKIRIRSKAFMKEEVERRHFCLSGWNLSRETFSNFVFSGKISNQTYLSDQEKILLLRKSGQVVQLEEVINYLDFEQFSQPQIKFYLCYP